jgi:peptidyl-prolyl cis-trans isomerase B (cyclophilin B)
MRQVDLETSAGTIRVELDDEKAPETVKNFLTNVENATTTAPSFTASSSAMSGRWLRARHDAKADARRSERGRQRPENDKYTLAMARTSAPHSATAQFFINAADNEFLNFKSETAQGWGYAVFGRVVSGQDVVDAIEKVRTGTRGGHADVPLYDVTITRATVVS